ncbi:MAG: hypothetical protein ACE5H3_05905, partial [Planctomycetota bacterium]
MRKGRVLGLLGILTVAGLLWWGVRSPEAPAPLPEDELPLALAASFSGPAPSAAPDSAAPALGPGSLAGRKDFALPDRPPVWLVVQVVRKDGGVPLAGVPVEITWAALGAMGPGVSGITGPDGRLRLRVQLSMEWVEARALPFRAGAARWGEPPPGSARAVLYNPAWKPGKG